MGWNTVLRFTVNFVISFAMIMAYVAAGALVFASLESGQEVENKKIAQSILNEFQNKYSLSDENLTDFLMTFNKIDHLTHGSVNSSHSVWNFQGAFYFCTTAITTIGTGNITPDTPSGQWFCIFYVIFGIPLISLFFGMTGYYLTQALRLIILKFETLLSLRMELFARQWAFAWTTWLIGSVALLINAAWMYKVMSNWSLGESFYYSLTTFSTIGFGDYTYYNGSPGEFPLVISSFVVLAFMLPASSLMFSTTAELFQTMICPVYLKSGLVKKSELQRILAEDQLLYRYRKMKKEMSQYKTFNHEQISDDDLDDLVHESSIGHDVLEEYLDSADSDSQSCRDTRG